MITKVKGLVERNKATGKWTVYFFVVGGDWAEDAKDFNTLAEAVDFAITSGRFYEVTIKL